jgi:6-pyruvoyltetrahydropterin/6-carboxytetrahydropterin synthase
MAESRENSPLARPSATLNVSVPIDDKIAPVDVGEFLLRSSRASPLGSLTEKDVDASRVRLTREVRFLVDPAQRRPLETPRFNSWGGWPSSAALALYLTLRATVVGVPDRRTGYLCDIHRLDRILHERAVTAAYDLCVESPSAFTGGSLLVRAYAEVSAHLPEHVQLETLELGATPLLRFSIRHANSEASPLVALTQQFEFSAAHRLRCDGLSDEENRALFGKCSNPSGHGHNYVLDVTVEGRPDERTGNLLPTSILEERVREVVIERFDHKNLNVDVAEFRELNPSVENIAQVVFNLLENEFAPHQLAAVRVYETPRSWAEVRGKSAP